jgi:hypothetical protein
MPWVTNLKTSLRNDEKAPRAGAMERMAEPRPQPVPAPLQPLRTRLVAACGWPTDAEPLARRRAKR